MVLGGGPNRIGQGIEFDYCWYTPRWRCAKTVTKPLWLTVTGNRLHRLRHFRPPLLRAGNLEDVLEIVRIEKPKGVIVQ